MKKQLVILLEYEEVEKPDRAARDCLCGGDVYEMIKEHFNDMGIGCVMSRLEVITADDSDMPKYFFDEVVRTIKGNVDD